MTMTEAGTPASRGSQSGRRRETGPRITSRFQHPDRLVEGDPPGISDRVERGSLGPRPRMRAIAGERPGFLAVDPRIRR